MVSGKKFILSSFPFFGRDLFKYYLDKIFARDLVDEIKIWYLFVVVKTDFI